MKEGGSFMKIGFKKLSSLLVGLVLMLGLLAACGGGGGSSAPADTGGGDKADDTAPSGDVRTVVVRGLYDITGGTGDVGTPYAEGQAAYFKYLESKGGFEGIKIDHDGKDYAYNMTEAQRIYQEFRDRDNASAIIGWGTGDTEALRQQVATDELPFASASYSENLKNIEESPYNFLVAASYSDQGRAILQWIKANHQGGEPTVALLYNDTAFGRSPVADIKAYAEEIGGIKIVDEQVIDVAATEAQSQLLNMQKANPDYAIINQTWNATATILRDAKTLGIETQFIGLNWTAGEGLIKLAGDVSEGFMASLLHCLPYEDFPGMAEINEYLKAEGKTTDDINQKYVQGWATAKIMAEGIRLAAEQKPEGDITGADIRAALETLNNFDLGGLGANVSFAPDNHAGTEQLRLGKVVNGKWEAITDYFSHRD